MCKENNKTCTDQLLTHECYRIHIQVHFKRCKQFNVQDSIHTLLIIFSFFSLDLCPALLVKSCCSLLQSSALCHYKLLSGENSTLTQINLCTVVPFSLLPVFTKILTEMERKNRILLSVVHTLTSQQQRPSFLYFQWSSSVKAHRECLYPQNSFIISVSQITFWKAVDQRTSPAKMSTCTYTHLLTNLGPRV